jgi:hypothetical protein
MSPQSLTEAARLSGIQLIVLPANNRTQSTAQPIRYSELYRQSNGTYETPLERLQRTVEDGIDLDSLAQ